MKLPESLHAVLAAIRPIGRPRLVGGCVRDWLLGLEPKDFDIEVFATSYESLARALAPFGPTDLVGKSFGTIKLRLDGFAYDFSLPRRESKTAAGHRGFEVETAPALSEAEAAARRDFTINAIAWDPFTDALIDPHGGERDLRAKILRHTSAAFTEDPLRVLRGFQFAARFDLQLAPVTAALCQSIAGTFVELPIERVWGEWDKWAAQSTVPSRGLAVLEETGWLEHFPEIAAMRGTPQEPEWHPEGDVFTHTQLCLDALVKLPAWHDADEAKRRILSFAVLAHDFGKPATTAQAEKRGQLRWTSPGHEAVGGPIAEAFLQNIGAPLNVIDWVRPLIVHHLAHHHGRTEFSDASVRRLARKLAPASIDDLCAVMLADHYGRPPLISAETLDRIETLRAKAKALAIEKAAPRPIILGRHLVVHGLTPGPAFKKILDACFEAQLEGRFANEVEGFAFLVIYLRDHPINN